MKVHSNSAMDTMPARHVQVPTVTARMAKFQKGSTCQAEGTLQSKQNERWRSLMSKGQTGICGSGAVRCPAWTLPAGHPA